MRENEPIFDEALRERGRDSSPILPPLLCGCAAVVLTAGFGAWVLSSPPVTPPRSVVVRWAAAPPPPPRVASPYGGLIAFAAPPSPPPRQAESNPFGALVDVRPESVAPSPVLATLLQVRFAGAGSVAVASVVAPPAAPLPPERDVAHVDAAAPPPPARPRELAALATPVRSAPRPLERAASAAPLADDRNAFQKLFGLGRSTAPAGPSLAYASPETAAVREQSSPAGDSTSDFSVFSRSSPLAGYDGATAVYDISARTVYLPDGTRLEAHSGLGEYLDDPRHVDVRMRGATPPHVYDLQAREELFHGVAALRLVPVGGDGSIYGRAGLLAHTYMLGPNGDSNGCVSFKDYDAFLKAFQDGRVTRLAVVAKL